LRQEHNAISTDAARTRDEAPVYRPEPGNDAGHGGFSYAIRPRDLKLLVTLRFEKGINTYKKVLAGVDDD